MIVLHIELMYRISLQCAMPNSCVCSYPHVVWVIVSVFRFTGVKLLIKTMLRFIQVYMWGSLHIVEDSHIDKEIYLKCSDVVKLTLSRFISCVVLLYQLLLGPHAKMLRNVVLSVVFPYHIRSRVVCQNFDSDISQL